MIPLTGGSLWKAMKSPFSPMFRRLLYDDTLSYGARCFGLARLSFHPKERILQSTLGRKMGVGDSQGNVWKKRLLASHYGLHFSDRQARKKS